MPRMCAQQHGTCTAADGEAAAAANLVSTPRCKGRRVSADYSRILAKAAGSEKCASVHRCLKRKRGR